MMCPFKKNLLDKEASFEAIQEKMNNFRRDYLKTRKGQNSLFVSDKAIVTYLTEVRRVSLRHYATDALTLHEYSKIDKISIGSVINEILTKQEMNTLVMRGSDRYEKRVGFFAQGKMRMKIKNLTVVNIEIIKDKASA